MDSEDTVNVEHVLEFVIRQTIAGVQSAIDLARTAGATDDAYVVFTKYGTQDSPTYMRVKWQTNEVRNG